MKEIDILSISRMNERQNELNKYFKICPKCGEIVPLTTEVCFCLLSFKDCKDLKVKESSTDKTDELITDEQIEFIENSIN